MRLFQVILGTTVPFLLFFAGTGFSWKRSDVPEKRDTLELDDFPGKVVQEVVVPIPSEVFQAMKTFGERGWDKVLNVSDYPHISDRICLALLLGRVIAEGFIAVEARDKPSVRKIGRQVLQISDSLALRFIVEKHCQSVHEYSDKGDWERVRRELDLAQATVNRTMKQMRDEELSSCISLAGWLRGVEATTELVEEFYSRQKAELLNQPEIVSLFQRSILKMGPGFQKNSYIRKISRGLDQIEELLNFGEEGRKHLSQEEVGRFHRICNGLVDSFSGSKALSSTSPRD